MNVKDILSLTSQQLDSSVSRLMDEIKNKENYVARFITPEEAFEMITDETLLVVVDTHKPSMVIEERVIK